MSAYFCDKETIDRVITAIRLVPAMLSRADAKRLAPLLADANQLGAALWELNRQSMLARYPNLARTDEDREMRAAVKGYVFEDAATTSVQLLKSMDCWQYQSCESDKVCASPLYRYVAVVMGRLAHSIVRNLPAYDKAVWG